MSASLFHQSGVCAIVVGSFLWGCHRNDGPLTVQAEQTVHLEQMTVSVSLKRQFRVDEPEQIEQALAATFSPDGTQLAILYVHGPPASMAWGQSVYVAQLTGPDVSHKVYELGHVDRSFYGVHGIGTTGRPCFSPDASELLVLSPSPVGQRRDLSIVDALTGDSRLTLERNSKSPIMSWAFSDDGRLLAVCGERMEPDPVNGLTRYTGGDVHVWELSTGRLLYTDSWDDAACRTAAFSPDGTQLVVGGGHLRAERESGELRLYDAVTGVVRQRVQPYASPVENVLFSPDGMHVITSNLGTELGFWRPGAEGATAFERLTLEQRPWRIAKMSITPDGKLLAVALSNYNRGQSGGGIRLIDVARRTQVGILLQEHSSQIDYVAFSPDGAWLAAQSETNAVVWQVLTVNGDGPAASTEVD